MDCTKSEVFDAREVNHKLTRYVTSWHPFLAIQFDPRETTFPPCYRVFLLAAQGEETYVFVVEGDPNLCPVPHHWGIFDEMEAYRAHQCQEFCYVDVQWD